MEYALEIVEQPVNKVRFKYGCEYKPQDSIQGIHSTLTNPTYPSLKIADFNGKANYRVSIAFMNSEPMLNFYELFGTTNITVEDGHQCAIFKDLSIIKKSKKVVKYIIEERVIDSYLKRSQDISITHLDVKEKTKLEAQQILKKLDMNNVRLKFDADILNSEGKILQSLTSVFSDNISDIKQNEELPLKIKKLDKLYGRCNGNEEIILLCEKIKNDDIAIRFYEEDPQGNLKWQGMGCFEPTDIHHKYAIVFKTPAYMNTRLQTPIPIKVQLIRPSNQEVSNSIDFTYIPYLNENDAIEFKRQKSENNCNFEVKTTIVEDRNLKLESGISLTNKGSVGSVTNTFSPLNQLINKKVVGLLKQMQLALWMYVSTNNVLYLLTPFIPLMSNPNEDGDNAIHLPIIHGYEEVALNILKKLEKKQDIKPINMLNHLKQSPLFLALVTNQKAVFKELLNLKSDWMSIDKEFNTLFHSCVYNSTQDILKILLDLLDKNTGHVINKKNSDGQTPLHLAIIKRKLEIVRMLINCKYVDTSIIENRGGRTALHMAVENEDVAITACLLPQCYGSINAQTYNGNTALHLAVIRSNLSIVSLLISFGADVTIKNYDTRSHVDSEDDDNEYYEESDESCSENDDINNDGMLPKDYCQNNSKIYDLLTQPQNLLEILQLKVTQTADEIDDSKRITEIPCISNANAPCLLKIDHSDLGLIDDNTSIIDNNVVGGHATHVTYVATDSFMPDSGISVDSGISSISTLTSHHE